MCGIVYSNNLNNKAVNRRVIRQYKQQRARGSEGFGYFLPDKNKLYHNTVEKYAMKRLKRQTATEVLFHHRYPTSTDNVINACHPFSTGDYYEHQYVVVHNGVLYDYISTAQEHLDEGVEYRSMQSDGSFNDSEVLAHEIARYIEGKTKKLNVSGSIAFIAVQLDKNGVKKALYFGRNSGNPLKMNYTDGELTLSSEGEGENIDTDTLYRLDYSTLDIKKAKVKIPEYSYTYSSTKWYVDDDDDELFYSPSKDDNLNRLYAKYPSAMDIVDEYIDLFNYGEVFGKEGFARTLDKLVHKLQACYGGNLTMACDAIYDMDWTIDTQCTDLVKNGSADNSRVIRLERMLTLVRKATYKLEELEEFATYNYPYGGQI